MAETELSPKFAPFLGMVSDRLTHSDGEADYLLGWYSFSGTP